MPSTYAHDRYGMMVLRKFPDLPGLSREAVLRNLETFRIGCQGPDLFFYYIAGKKDPAKPLGSRIHYEPAEKFFRRIPRLPAEEPEETKERKLSYLAGFLCHFTLDSCCHPYIEALIHRYSVPHSFVEGEFERFLMEKDGEDPVRFRTADGRIVPSKRSAEAAAWFYPEADEKVLLRAMTDMVEIHHLLYAPHAAKRALIDAVLRLAGKYKELGGHVIRPEADDRLLSGDRELLRRMEDAVSLAADLMRNAFEWYLSGGKLDPYFKRDFEAGPDWRSIRIP